MGPCLRRGDGERGAEATVFEARFVIPAEAGIQARRFRESREVRGSGFPPARE